MRCCSSEMSADSIGSSAVRSAKRSPSSPSPSPIVWLSEHRRLDGVERLLDVVQLQLGRLRQLLDRRRTAELGLELLRGAPQLQPALLHVDRDPDRVGLVRDRTLTGLADPPRRIRRELEALPVVELLDRAVEADRAVLDQVEQRQAVALVALGDRDDEAQVRVRHPLLGGVVAALDPLRERDLLGGGQQLVAADLVQKELQAVGRARRRRGAKVELELRVVGLLDLDVRGREGSAEPLDGLLVEIVLDVQRLELGGGHGAALLCIVQEGGDGRVQFKGVSAQSFIRAQLFLQGVFGC